MGERPATVSQLANDLGIDKASVSRVVASAETEGWLVRSNGIISLGPRGTAIGRGSAERSFERRASELAHAIAGVTGLDTVVNQLGGERAHILAHAVGRHVLYLEDAELDARWLVTTAAGACLLSQATEDGRASIVAAAGAEPDAAWLTAAREDRSVLDRGRVLPGVTCIALPWRGSQLSAPTAVSCIGTFEDVEAVEGVVAAALAAAVEPAATPTSVLLAASAAVTESS